MQTKMVTNVADPGLPPFGYDPAFIALLVKGDDSGGKHIVGLRGTVNSAEQAAIALDRRFTSALAQEGYAPPVSAILGPRR